MVEVFFKCFIVNIIISNLKNVRNWENGNQESDSSPYMSLQAFMSEIHQNLKQNTYTIATNRVKYYVGKYLIT